MTEIDYGLETSDIEKLEEVERSHILRVLEKANWIIDGVLGAVSVLGLNPATLRPQMKKRYKETGVQCVTGTIKNERSG